MAEAKQEQVQQVPQSQPETQIPQTKTNTESLISLIVGVLSLCMGGLPLGIVSIILGWIGLNKVKQSGGLETGKELAIIGIVLGALNLVIFVIALFCVGLSFVPICFTPFIGTYE